MGATEQGFYEIARGRGVRFDREVAVEGLSSRGHEDSTLTRCASSELLLRLVATHAMLGGNAALLATKRSVPLRLDFYAAKLDLFIELDETQHFSTDRARALALYGETGTEWTSKYIHLIHVWSSKADRYRASKQAVDFPRLGGRRAQRAFLDTVRDLAGPEVGIRILRIPAPERNAAIAYARFEAALART